MLLLKLNWSENQFSHCDINIPYRTKFFVEQNFRHLQKFSSLRAEFVEVRYKMKFHKTIIDHVILFTEHVEGGENNMTDYDYKGELKVTGRMHILGQNAEYTIKFLHQESQLLTEVWLPDIGVNQGMLTIRAGLKQQKPDSEIQTINGPTLLIRMDPFTNSAVIVGKVSTLGFSRISAIKVEDNGFSAKIFGSLPGNVNSDISLRSDYTENIQNANFQVKSLFKS